MSKIDFPKQVLKSSEQTLTNIASIYLSTISFNNSSASLSHIGARDTKSNLLQIFSTLFF